MKQDNKKAKISFPAHLLIFTTVFIVSLVLASNTARAESCSGWKLNGDTTHNLTVTQNHPFIRIDFNIQDIPSGSRYIICTDKCQSAFGDFVERDVRLTDDGPNIKEIRGNLRANDIFETNHSLYIRNMTNPYNNACGAFAYALLPKKCTLGATNDPNQKLIIYGNEVITGLPNYFLTIGGTTKHGQLEKIKQFVIPNQPGYFGFQTNKVFVEGNYSAYLKGLDTIEPHATPRELPLCGIRFSVTGDHKIIDIAPDDNPPIIRIDPTCNDGKGINTALGCIPASDLNDFVGWLLKNVIFVASGIAFLLMAFGALQIITSAGSPDKMKAGSELITSALSGLLLIILSLFLLKLIGVDILQIPGFGK